MKEGTHFTASVYIIFEDKVLLHKHKRFDLVLPVGGYVEGAELPEETVVREALEETGLDISVYDSEPNKISTDVWRQVNHGQGLAAINSARGVVQLDFAFFATTDSLEKLGSGEMDKDSFYVMTKNDIEKSELVSQDVKFYATQALDALGKH